MIDRNDRNVFVDLLLQRPFTTLLRYLPQSPVAGAVPRTSAHIAAYKWLPTSYGERGQSFCLTNYVVTPLCTFGVVAQW